MHLACTGGSEPSSQKRWHTAPEAAGLPLSMHVGAPGRVHHCPVHAVTPFSCVTWHVLQPSNHSVHPGSMQLPIASRCSAHGGSQVPGASATYGPARVTHSKGGVQVLASSANPPHVAP